MPGAGQFFGLRLRTWKPWTRDRRKWSRLSSPLRGVEPRRFGFRGSLKDLGGIRRTMLLHGLEVARPRRVGFGDWHFEATAPASLSRDRLLRLCNLIDRTPSLARLTAMNVALFRWFGLDRRQPVEFYDLRNARYWKRRR